MTDPGYLFERHWLPDHSIITRIHDQVINDLDDAQRAIGKLKQGMRTTVCSHNAWQTEMYANTNPEPPT